MDTVHLARNDLADIGRSVLDNFLKLPVAHVDGTVPGAESCSATIDISGHWNGTVEIRCTPGMAREIAARMFHRPPDEVDATQVSDALDEVTNIVGGNVKALLPAPSRLSLPDFHLRAGPQQRADVQVQLVDANGGAFWIGVRARQPA